MRRTFWIASGWTAFIFATYLVVGLRAAPPQTIAEGEICYRCHRVITHARLAAEILDRNLPTKYKTPGCMATYVASHPSRKSRYFVTDFVSGSLIEAEHAYFVPVVIDDRRNERDYRAYYSRGMADIAAQVLGVPVVRWSTLIERAQVSS
jgi:hypothetical protein